MIPRRIVLENFLSFGSPATEIVFADDEPLWVIAGPNGVGKSAVFDAMTYALFAEHRGGASDHGSLIRHGANGFRVDFEFEFNAIDYCIKRTRTYGGRTTQRVYRRKPAGDGWDPVANVNSVAEVKAWSERTLGLGFPAFTASVLLRQGEADKVITAGGADRLKILKKLIGVERYEALSNTVHSAAKGCKDRLGVLQTQLNGLTTVSEAEVQAAQNALSVVEKALSTAQEHAKTTAGRVPYAQRWVELDSDRGRLEKQIANADARAAKASHIRDDCARLNDLQAALPALRQIVTLRKGLAKAEAILTERRAEAERIRAALQAKGLRDEIARHIKTIEAADGLRKLRDEISEFDPSLAEKLVAAQEVVQTTTASETTAIEAKAAAVESLNKAKAQQQKFAVVGVGVKCSLCGQEVTADHAKQERDRLAAEVREMEQKARESGTQKETATRARQAAEKQQKRLEELAQKRETTAQLLAEKESTLASLGVTADPDKLRQQLADMTAEAARHEANAGDQRNADRPTLETRLAEVDKKVRADEQTVTGNWAKHDTLVGQLAPAWQTQIDSLDAVAVDALETERQWLAKSGVVEQFQLLEQDAALRAEWVNRLTEAMQKIADIPLDCQVPVADAQAAVQKADEKAAKAQQLRGEVKNRADDLAYRAEDYQKKVKEVAEAEQKARLHDKLDRLLGKSGLQRELVRSAEREIVRLANDTVQNLSDGDLAIELDDSADGCDEAFALQVRRADAPKPIGVYYLSGSQKFRVAVSIALAIGRFAAGQARRLESVIIDEGFGSLDKDGLRAAADELNRLRQHLRRIILVSHQEDFADRFSTILRLSHGENGTTVTSFRR